MFARIDRHKVPHFRIVAYLSFPQRHQLARKAAFCVPNLIHAYINWQVPTDLRGIYSAPLKIRPIYRSGSTTDGLEGLHENSLVTQSLSPPFTPLKAQPPPLDLSHALGDFFLMCRLFTSGQAEKYFALRSSPSLIRHHREAFKQKPRTFMGASFFAHRVISVWNAFPEEIATLASRSTFENKLEKTENNVLIRQT